MRPAAEHPVGPAVTDPGELAALIPFQLGFVPHSSVVAVGLRAAGRSPSGRPALATGGIGRIDLPRRTQDAAAVVRALTTCLAPSAPEAVLLVVYGDRDDVSEAPGTRPGRAGGDPGGVVVRTVDELLCAFGDAGVDVLDVLHVEDARWRSLLCHGVGCCPPGGRPLPQAREVPVVAELVGRGSAPLPDRSELARTAAAGTDPTARLVAEVLAGARAATRRRPVTVRTVLRRWRDAVLAPALHVAADPRVQVPLPSPSQLARLVAELEQDAEGWAGLPPRAIRDAVLTWCDPDDGLVGAVAPALLPTAVEVLGPCRSLDSGTRAAVVDRVASLVRALPPEGCAEPSAVLAVLAWRLGDPVRARVAAEQTLAAVPGHSLARIVETALDHGIPGRSELLDASWPSGAPVDAPRPGTSTVGDREGGPRGRDLPDGGP